MTKCALRILCGVMLFAPLAAVAQAPAGVPEALRNLTSERANHTSFTFDHGHAAVGYWISE